MDTNIKPHIDALKDILHYLQEQLDSSNKTIFILRNQISDLQKRCKSYKATIDGFSEVSTQVACKTAAELQLSIDKKIKAAYKDGYGAALQKVLNITKEIDEKDTNENSSQNAVDNYLSAHKGKFIFRIKDTKERKSDIERVLFRVFNDINPLQIDLWLQKNVMLVNGWTNLFVDISEELCLAISNKIESNRKEYPFLNYEYFSRE